MIVIGIVPSLLAEVIVAVGQEIKSHVSRWREDGTDQVMGHSPCPDFHTDTVGRVGAGIKTKVASIKPDLARSTVQVPTLAIVAGSAWSSGRSNTNQSSPVMTIVSHGSRPHLHLDDNPIGSRVAFERQTLGLIAIRVDLLATNWGIRVRTRRGSVPGLVIARGTVFGTRSTSRAAASTSGVIDTDLASGNGDVIVVCVYRVPVNGSVYKSDQCRTRHYDLPV